VSVTAPRARARLPPWPRGCTKRPCASVAR
jgi:hypothetical protein